MSDLKIKLKIEGMHCTSCAMLIDGDLEELEGVKSSNTSFAKEVCEIEFHKFVELEKITEIIEKLGYKTKLII